MRVVKLLLALVLAIAGAEAIRGADAAKPPAPLAGLWVDASGSDEAPCTRAEPCLTIDRAVAAASPGDNVYVAAGTYPEQTLRAHEGKGPRYVIVRPVPGARPVITSLVVEGSFVEFRDLTIGAWEAKPTASFVTFRDVTNAGFWIEGSSNISLIGGSVGPGVDVHPIIGPEGAQVPRNILIHNVTFHDWTRSSADSHTECLQVGGADGLVIRRSRFRNCAVFDVFMSYWGDGPAPRNITLENNYFAAPLDEGYYAVRFADYPASWENVSIRYNSALASIEVDPKPSLVGVTMVANVAPLPQAGCEPRIVYRYNVWNGARCGATDVDAIPRFVAPAALDLRLQRKSRAVGHGDPTSFPRVDIDGRKRPAGKRPNAGASETVVR